MVHLLVLMSDKVLCNQMSDAMDDNSTTNPEGTTSFDNVTTDSVTVPTTIFSSKSSTNEESTEGIYTIIEETTTVEITTNEVPTGNERIN